MNKKWLLAAGVGSLILVSAAGIGIGQARTVPVKTGSPAVTRPVRGADTEAKAGVDKDNLQVQQGSQVRDIQGEGTAGGSGEAAQATEPDSGTPGGGHADPNGANGNQDFQGVQ